MTQLGRRILYHRINSLRHIKGLSVLTSNSESGDSQHREIMTDAQLLKVHGNKLVDTLDKQKHGTTNTYKCGCRCPECVLANKLKHNL